MTRGPATFPREARLLRRAEFEEAFAKGRRVQGRLFVLIRLARDGGLARLGVVASRKVGGAVRRNRCKRLIREAFRRNRATIGSGQDLVVVARGPLGDARYDEVESELLALLRRGGGDRSGSSPGGGTPLPRG